MSKKDKQVMKINWRRAVPVLIGIVIALVILIVVYVSI